MAFGSVASQSVSSGKTVELVLNQLSILGDSPAFVVEHLGESNRAFWNDVIARANVNATDSRRGKLTEADIAAGRAKNRANLAKYSVKDLRGFYHDVEGQPGTPDPTKPATKADIVELLQALPNDVIDSVMTFVVNAENFRERPVLADAKTVAEK